MDIVTTLYGRQERSWQMQANCMGCLLYTSRGIFAINELPDLSERIQVGLLNVLEERDVQIRGHRIRLPLDITLVATANPEDYTNRGLSLIHI